MHDGTGKTNYYYDQLDRLTKTIDGHVDTVEYEYDLANELTKIVYPKAHTVTRSYDKAGRLSSVTDWLEHATKFTYDPDSDIAATVFPKGTSDEDKYVYNDADQMTEIKMTREAETLALLVYTRDSDGQLKTTTSKGLPGEEKISAEYDSNSRLTKSGTLGYEYDPADNPTKVGSSTNAYNSADELETGTGIKYAYNELGERIKTTPKTAATTYGYDQAGNLISVSRPKEGEAPAIEDTYAYDGNGLRASQTISGTTSYLTWGYGSANLPLLLNDGANSYIYGPGNLPIEQINSESKVLYLHHDQQGSTRMLTGSTGKNEGSATYDAYGNKTGTAGTATTPLGYDSQYTNTDTGLIYLRQRAYDPATAQFLSADAVGGLTLSPYGYVYDNPLNYSDPTGLELFGIPGIPSPGEVVNTVKNGFNTVVHEAQGIANSAANAAENAATTAVSDLRAAGKTVAEVAHYAAPIIDAATAAVCVVVTDGTCADFLLGNFLVQQGLVADQTIFLPGYSPGLDEAAIFAGTGLGATGLVAVANGGLQGFWRAAFAGSVTYPQLWLDAGQALGSGSSMTSGC